MTVTVACNKAVAEQRQTLGFVGGRVSPRWFNANTDPAVLEGGWGCCRYLGYPHWLHHRDEITTHNISRHCGIFTYKILYIAYHFSNPPLRL
jgi:hypothetical protein